MTWATLLGPHYGLLADIAATVTDLTDQPWAPPRPELIPGELVADPVEVARELAAELSFDDRASVDVLLEVVASDGHVSRFRVTGDGGVRHEQGLPAEESLPDALRAAAREKRLDLDAEWERAQLTGRPLTEVVATSRNHAAIRAAWAGVDVDAVIEQASSLARPAEELLTEHLLRQRRRQAEHEVEFREALRRVLADLDVGRLLEFGRDVQLRELFDLFGAEEFPDAVAAAQARGMAYVVDIHTELEHNRTVRRAALRAAPAGATRRDWAESAEPLARAAGWFGFDPAQPEEVDRFRALLRRAGMAAEPSPTEQDTLRMLAAELALAHDLYESGQRRQVVELDPGWLLTGFRARPSYLPLLAPLPLAPSHPQLERTTELVLDRYYRGRAAGPGRSGARAPRAFRDRVRSAVYHYGVAFGAWQASQLPGAEPLDDTAPPDFLAQIGDPNTPTRQQQRYLNEHRLRPQWTASGTGSPAHDRHRAMVVGESGDIERTEDDDAALETVLLRVGTHLFPALPFDPDRP